MNQFTAGLPPISLYQYELVNLTFSSAHRPRIGRWKIVPTLSPKSVQQNCCLYEKKYFQSDLLNVMLVIKYLANPAQMSTLPMYKMQGPMVVMALRLGPPEVTFTFLLKVICSLEVGL